MTESISIEKIKNHKPTLIGLRESKKAAVCIPLIKTEDGYDVLFEVRSSKIDSQPGDICFPGGMVEAGENCPDAAVREMCEELLVQTGQVEILGALDILATIGGLLIYPYAAILHDYRGTFSTDEVEQVFRVPLSFFLENKPEIYETVLKVVPGEDFPYERIHGGRDYQWRQRRDSVYFYRYGARDIWGLTARIMASFVELL